MKKHPIDELLQRIYGVSDDDILQEFEAVEAEVMAEGETEPSSEEFERLWEEISQNSNSSS